MGFFTKVDYSRQLRQYKDTLAEFSGSTRMEQNLGVYEPTWGLAQSAGGCPNCRPGSTGYTFMVGSPSYTSGTSAVAITSFSGVSGITGVISIGQPPMSPHTGGTMSPGISASTLQINWKDLLYAGQLGNTYYDLSIDASGNIVRTLPSSLRYKTNLKEVENFRYNKLLDIPPYFFDYIGSGGNGYGLIAEMVHEAGFKELVIYDNKNRPDNIEYKMLSVALLKLIQDLHSRDEFLYGESKLSPGDVTSRHLGATPLRGVSLSELTTKVVNTNYTTNGEYLLIVSTTATITLNSNKDTKIKIKSLSSCTVIPDKGKIDGKWESVELGGDSCVEFVFVKELDCWVISSSDGLKDI